MCVCVCVCGTLMPSVSLYIHQINTSPPPPPPPHTHTHTQATFAVHSRKRSIVGDLIVVGDGVWISFIQDSTLRLYNATTFTHMQDLDIAPAIRRNIGTFESHLRQLIFP